MTDAELLVLYDVTFEQATDRKDSIPGQAHIAALRAIYEKGKTDGQG